MHSHYPYETLPACDWNNIGCLPADIDVNYLDIMAFDSWENLVFVVVCGMSRCAFGDRQNFGMAVCKQEKWKIKKR